MNFSIEKIHTEYEQVLGGYTGLLTCRLLNLCVKAHPVALIPVIVEVRGEEKVFENVADCSIPDEDHIDAYPKEESFLSAIGKGVLEVHPEFSMSQKTVKINDKDTHYLSFKMPVVNKDRRDVLNTGVDVFYEEAKVQYESAKTKYSVKLTEELAGIPVEEADEAQAAFDNTYKTNIDIAEETVKKKKQEIEDAYQRYLQGKQEAENAIKEKQEAEGKEIKSQFKMPFDE